MRFPSADSGVSGTPPYPIQAFCSRPELATYLPVASGVKAFSIKHFERQVLILLATPPVYRGTSN